METALVVGVATVAPFVVYKARTYFNTTVNCWFCNENTKVPWKKRNAFVCPSCQQYNGFTESGDYNKKLYHGGRSTPEKAPSFCRRDTSLGRKRQPDLIPDRIGGLSIGKEKATNGLCSDCNRNQEIIMRQVAQFEPKNEDRWNEELDELRYKLDRVYSLCAHCTLAVHGKLQSDKTKYEYLLNIKNRVKSYLGTKMDRVINPDKKRSRRNFFAGGQTCEVARVVAFFVSIVSFFTHLDQLQKDADFEAVQLPDAFRLISPTIFGLSTCLQGAILVAHFIACYSNKCRFTLPDLLLPIISFIHLSTCLVPDDIVYQEDVFICKCACSSLLAVLATATLLLPRKMLHKKKPNRYLSSAFSVASTPVSQCSSQNLTVLDDTRFGDGSFSPTSDVSRVSLSPESKMRYRERAQTPFNVTIPRNSPAKQRMGEEMDWEDSESVATVQTARTYQSNLIKPSLLATLRSERCRESTPSRELAPSIASISILGCPTPRSTQPSIFSSVSQRRPGSRAPTIPGARSMIRSISPPRSNAESVFTSVSQQQNETSTSSRTQLLIVGLMLLVLVFQVAVLYVMLRK